ncbi:uncharacterized protein LOC108875510 [Lates calcarifer]|uniref:Uncharacterized protein LOC108875510 n=1 Tax=Lates calcarifer TaxID=8187 RepID=A0AAJ8B240_LATCA|nr:uncharacterized protein LOC108875510 [Lates calcarifer]XP_050924978.1 uncharacterized protein LOC108875510 [Lates calcarifer]XP_050924979.1 uncharacterized protein LOC108875510 [Lates calcarifer]XP_050924980.1 uncharacterized protein LOC108875510 [Lates calcarifer]
MPWIVAAGIPRTQFSKIYLLAALKLDPDLDVSPQIHPPNPPPYDSATPSERGQADPSTMPQQKPSSETAQPGMSAPPQNSTSKSSSPIAHRLCHHAQDAVFNMPMVEVSGPEGATLVFRAGTSADITATSQHLPNPTASGKAFVEQFSTFCQEFKPTTNELKRLLITKMKPTDWQRIACKFPAVDIRRRHINWEDQSNAQYRDAVHNLCETFTQAFPGKADLEKVTVCRQKDDENPDEYLTRLTEVFNTHSGLQPPDELRNTPDVWEIHLCNCFFLTLSQLLKIPAFFGMMHSCPNFADMPYTPMTNCSLRKRRKKRQHRESYRWLQ